MRKTVLIALMSLAIVAGFGSCGKTEYDMFGDIAGTVIDKISGEPLGNVLITLKPKIQNAYSGIDGSFQFINVDAGHYDVWVQKDGYESTKVNANVIAGETVIVNIVMKPNDAE